MEAGFSGEFCGTLPKAGMMRNGRLYPLSMLERRTCEKEFGLLPTPRCFDESNAMPKNYEGGKTIKSSTGKTGGISLNAYVQIFPTPMASDADKNSKNRTKYLPGFVQLYPTPKANSGNGAGHHGQGGIDLQTAVKLWPTPTTSEATHGSPNQHDSKGRYGLTSAVVHYSPLPTAVLWRTPDANMDRGNRTYENMKMRIEKGRPLNLNDQLNAIGKGLLPEPTPNVNKGNAGRLNADWVERLMGYPDSWTDAEKETADPENRYPAAWLDGSWDTIPRLAVGQKNRARRIKGLGNAIVPQIAAYLWGLVRQWATK
jgi:hypothetical protein